MTNHETDRRAQWANALWEAAEQNTIAEWICCDPIDPKHGLCVAGGKALEMLRALIVDDPEAYKPAPLTTVALELAAVSVPPLAPRADASCVCGEPEAPSTVHRTDGPCHTDGRREAIALAIARVDAGKWGTDVPLREHPMWQAYLAYGEAVLAMLTSTRKPELRRLAAVSGPCVAGEQQNETPEAEAQQQPIPCNASHLRVHHAPHGWEPQPGMNQIPCPGYTKE